MSWQSMPAMTHTMQGILCRDTHPSAAAGQAKGRSEATDNSKSEGSDIVTATLAINIFILEDLEIVKVLLAVDSFQSCTKPSVWQGKLNPESIGFLCLKPGRWAKAYLSSNSRLGWTVLTLCGLIQGLWNVQNTAHVVFESEDHMEHMYKVK